MKALRRLSMMIFLLTGCNQTVSVYVEQDIKTNYGPIKGKIEYKLINDKPILPNLPKIKQEKLLDVELVEQNS